MADYLILQVQFDAHMIASPRLPADARLHPKWLLLLIAVNIVTGWQLLGTLRSLFLFSKSFSTTACSQLYSHPTQHLPQYENLGYIMCLHIWLLLTQTLFPCLAQPLIPVHWILLAVPHMGSLTLTAQFEGLLSDQLKMEFTERHKLSLPVPARLLEKVNIIVSLPAINTVVTTSNNLLGSLTFKTPGNLLPPYISSPW